MKDVEVFFALLPIGHQPGKFHRSRWMMTREEAVERGGTVIENTRLLRHVLTTDEERRQALPGINLPVHAVHLGK